MLICAYHTMFSPFFQQEICGFSAWCLACHSKFRFCGVRMGISVSGTTVLKGKGKSDTSAIWIVETCDRAEAICLMIFYSSFTFSAHVN